MFLVDAVAGYVENLTEREFDAPFIALLYRLGYTRVHLVHGPYEFGKDFIAQREENGTLHQYCFQSKAGDLGTSGWRDVSQQVEAMRTGSVVHPDFDPALHRRLVVVTNGRLKGGAGTEFQNYNEYHSGRGESPAELWDIDHLVPQFEAIFIEGVPVRARARTLEMLGRLGQGTGDRRALREFSREWFAPALGPKERWGHVLTGALLAKEAFDHGREDLASQVAFLLIRAAWENPSSAQPNPAELDVARRLFSTHAQQFWEEVQVLDVLEVTTRSQSGLDAFVTHPVKAARLSECLSLLGILSCLDGDANTAESIADYLAAFTDVSPGGAHMISDEWAFSLLVTTLLFVITNQIDLAAKVLRTAAVWLLDKIEFGKGIAGVGEPAEAAVKQLMGPVYSHVRLAHQASSYGFTVILDLAHICGLRDLYEDLLNDLHALSAMATVVIQRSVGEAELAVRLSYSLTDPTPAVHHDVPIDSMPAARDGKYFDCLASWATMRDRHVPALLRRLASLGCAPPTSH